MNSASRRSLWLWRTPWHDTLATDFCDYGRKSRNLGRVIAKRIPNRLTVSFAPVESGASTVGIDVLKVSNPQGDGTCTSVDDLGCFDDLWMTFVNSAYPKIEV